MIKRGIALRYAKALFDLDLVNEGIQKRVKDFQMILQLFENYPSLIKLLDAPQILQEEKEVLLRSCLKEITDPLLFRFLLYLMKQKRLNIFKEILSEYGRLVDEQEGFWEAELRSKVPIETSIKEKLVVKLEEFYHKKIVLKEIIDPQMIGGVLLTIANHVIDWSIRSRMEKLKGYLS